MRIIYMHHAERDKRPNHNDPLLRQKEDITDRGIKESELLGELFKDNNYNIKAIVSSPYKRCVHTAEIINKYINVPIIEDERFNEANSGEEIESGALWQRTIDGIKDIINQYTINDDILIITSGINLTGFICYFYNIDPKSKPTISQGVACSPINFIVKNK